MPLFLLYLSNIGDIMARSFKWLYATCYLCKGCPNVSKRRAERRQSRRRMEEYEMEEYPDNPVKYDEGHRYYVNSPEQVIHLNRFYAFNFSVLCCQDINDIL